MDLATLSALAEQLAPLVLQKIKGKGKKEVSELNTVSDYSNIYSMPCFYWNKETGEKKAVNLAMEAIVQSLEDAANEELIAIKQAATEAKESALESSSQAAEAERKAAEAAEYALQQKEATELYLNTVLENEKERKSAETLRAQDEAARKQAETDRQSAWAAWFENTTSGVKALWNTWFAATKKTWTDWFTAVKDAWNEFNTTASQAETARVNAENTRREQEVGRVSAEQARASEFATIKSEATKATGAANTAAAAVNTSADKAAAAATSANKAADSANTAAEIAKEKASLANTAAQNSDKQTLLCKDATDLATEMNEHPLKYGDNGNWWKWNVETDQYEDTGIIAKGGGMYPMIRSRRNHVIWYDSTESFKDRITRRRNHTVIKF